MADPLVQNQQPLNQTSNQQPISQRAIDPMKLRSALVTEHYKKKINTILGEDSEDAAEIFNMPDVGWKEKYNLAKQRTSGMIDNMDEIALRPNSTIQELDEFFLTNNHRMTIQESSAYRQNRSEIEQKLYEQKRSNDLKIEATADIYDLLIGEIKQNIVYNKKTIAPEIQAELNKIVDEFNIDMDSWNTGKRSDILQIQKSLYAIALGMDFPAKYSYFDEAIGQRVTIDVDQNEQFVRDKWVEKQLKKIKTGRENIDEIETLDLQYPESKGMSDPTRIQQEIQPVKIKINWVGEPK